MIPEFHENDEVHFELDSTGTGPRWMLNVDKGGSGEWTVGIITEITDVAIRLDAVFPNGDIKLVVFPNWKSTDYDPEQWWYPGYLRGTKDPGPSCDCGCGNEDDTGHWNFCARGKWLKNNEKKS